MKRGFVAAALMTGALAIGGTAAALEVPERYTVTVEYFPEGGGVSVKASMQCHRAESCHGTMKVFVDGKERKVLLTSYTRSSELLELQFDPDSWSAPAFAERVVVRKAYERELTAEKPVTKWTIVPAPGKTGAVPNSKSVEQPKGRVRFTVHAG